METESHLESTSRNWRKILVHEMGEYLFNLAFLAIFLVAFAWYRRLILAAYHIHYVGYWAPLIESAILAKVIMIGDVLRLGRRLRNRPLAMAIVYRSIVFSVLVVLFSFLEHIVGALLHGKTASEGLTEIANKGVDEVLAWCVVIFAAFLPFFTLKELERVLGEQTIRKLLFRGRAAGPDPVE